MSTERRWVGCANAGSAGEKGRECVYCQAEADAEVRSKALSRQQEPPTAHILLRGAPPQLETPVGPVSYFHVEIHPRCPSADTLPVHCS